MAKKRRIVYDSDSDSETSETSFKRVKRDLEIVTPSPVIDFSTYNSASSIHNYMLNDPIIDYLKLKKRGFSNKQIIEVIKEELEEPSDEDELTNTEEMFFNFIVKQGTKFETSVVNYIRNKVDSAVTRESTKHVEDVENFIRISYNYNDIINPESYTKTVKAIKDGIPIIYQGVLYDTDAKTFGSPDFIIRSDFLEYIVEDCIVDLDDKAPKLNGKYYYVIMDIKYNILKLTADGIHILNSGRAPANKGQVLIYNRMLSKIQGYQPKYAYIMGRGYEYTCCRETFRSDQCDKKFGHIDTRDKILNEKVDDALKWLSDLKKNGHKWTYDTDVSLIKEELFPNMCNKYDAPFHSEKKKIAEHLEELTLIWNVGYKHRITAHDKGVYKWSDPTLNTDILGINGKTGNIVQEIIKINNDKDNNTFLRPKKILNNFMNWQNIEQTQGQQTQGQGQNTQACIEFYIDFELVNKIFDDMSEIPRINSKEYVFMIGLYYVQYEIVQINGTIGNKYEDYKQIENTEYFNFTAESLSDGAEYKIFNDMNNKIKELCLLNNCNSEDVNIYHWGSIEQDVYKKIMNKYYLNNWTFLKFCNVLTVFKQEPIFVKGCFNYSLKEIVKAFVNKGLIKDNWDNSCTNGLSAMILAEKCYRTLNTCNVSNVSNSSVKTIGDFDDIKNIINYNKIDCIVIYDLVNYLRKNYI